MGWGKVGRLNIEPRQSAQSQGSLGLPHARPAKYPCCELAIAGHRVRVAGSRALRRVLLCGVDANGHLADRPIESDSQASILRFSHERTKSEALLPNSSPATSLNQGTRGEPKTVSHNLD